MSPEDQKFWEDWFIDHDDCLNAEHTALGMDTFFEAIKLAQEMQIEKDGKIADRWITADGQRTLGRLVRYKIERQE